MKFSDMYTTFRAMVILGGGAFGLGHDQIKINSGKDNEEVYEPTPADLKRFYETRGKEFFDDLAKPLLDGDHGYDNIYAVLQAQDGNEITKNCDRLTKGKKFTLDDLKNLISFELALRYVVKVEHNNFNNFIEKMTAQLFPDLEQHEIKLKVNQLRQEHLVYIKQHQDLNPCALQPIDSLEREIDQVNERIKAKEEEHRQLREKLEGIEAVKQQSESMLRDQINFLENIAYEYVVGSKEYKTVNELDHEDYNLRAHNGTDDFYKIFNKEIFDYNNGFPEIRDKHKHKQCFQSILGDIFANCLENRSTFFVRNPLQAGKVSIYLREAVNKNRHKLGLRITSGNVREKEKFACEKVGENPYDLNTRYESELRQLATEEGIGDGDDLQKVKNKLKQLEDDIAKLKDQRGEKIDKIAKKVDANAKVVAGAYQQKQAIHIDRQDETLKGALERVVDEALANMRSRNQSNNDKYKTLVYLKNQISEIDKDNYQALTDHFYLLERVSSTKRGIFGRTWSEADTYTAIKTDLTTIRDKFQENFTNVVDVKTNVESTNPPKSFKTYFNEHREEIYLHNQAM
ncbi:hypothetical protein L3V82_11250 [Thiotrichales bacterium 19S3-7]|nr:hypothetical protein [Thiotrichales bacterium 19S3-7]MCF6802756.1 hypothetical protein [Thiotrichales bacterium 19S3-11]